MHHHRPHANHTGKPASRLGAMLYDSYQRGMERWAAAERSVVQVGDQALPILVAGKGEPLLLLHGFSDRKETWLPILPALAKQHRVYVPDLPGFGAAPDLHPDLANVRDLTGVVRQLLDVLGLQRLHVAGQSMGGAIAARLTHDHPERVASLFLLSAAGPVGLHPALADVPIVAGHPLLPGNKDGFDDLLRATFHRPPPLPKAVKQHVGALWSGRHDRHLAYFQRMMNPQGDESLPMPMVPCSVPTMLAYGKSDRIVHPDNVTSYQQCFVCAEVWWMERVGHAAQFERPFALTKRMLAHTRRHAMGR